LWIDKEIKMPDKDAVGGEDQLAGAEAEAVEGPGATEEVEAEELDEVGELRDELQEAKSEAEEYLDGWRRTQAEFSNYKKRQRAEQETTQKLANAELLRKLLPVMDDFERAFATVPQGIVQLTWIQGLLMVMRKLELVLESEGVKPIETAGEMFDPHYHEAVTHEEVPGYEEGQVIGEVQQGYVLGDRVLRPALVRVAKVPPVVPEQDQTEEQEEVVVEQAVVEEVEEAEE
jgi:molecular chaperone GrpE